MPTTSVRKGWASAMPLRETVESERVKISGQPKSVTSHYGNGCLSQFVLMIFHILLQNVYNSEGYAY